MNMNENCTAVKVSSEECILYIYESYSVSAK